MTVQMRAHGPRGSGTGVGASANAARARAMQDYASRFERAAGGRKAALREAKGRFTFEVLRGGKPTRANPPVGEQPVTVDAHSRGWPKGHAPKGPKPVDVARASIAQSLAAGLDRLAAESRALTAVRQQTTATERGAKIVVTRALNETAYAGQTPAPAPRTPAPRQASQRAKAPKKAPQKAPKQPRAPAPAPASQLALIEAAPTLADPASLKANQRVVVLGLDEAGVIKVAQTVKNKTAAKSLATDLMPAHIKYRLVLEIHSSYQVR